MPPWRDGNAFRRSGRSRGVDDVGGVVRMQIVARGRRRLPRNGGPIGIELHDACRHTRAMRSTQRRLGEQNRRAGILQHEGETVGRVGRIERQIGAAGLEDAQQPDQHLQRALDAQPNHHLGSDPEAAQMMRQLVGAGIERRIGEALIARTPPRLRLECAPLAQRTAPARSQRGLPARCRSSRTAASDAPRRPECRADRSRNRAALPKPPASV